MVVLLLKGGDSPEREVSLKSAENILPSLVSLGHDVVEFDTAGSVDELVTLANRADVVFLALHGIGGEDGEIQKILEDLGVPYLGSDSASSKLCINKVKTHELLEKNNIKMPAYEVLHKDNIQTSAIITKPFVAKPICGGSSLDTIISRDINDLRQPEVTKLVEKYGEILVEELIVGSEITVPVLRNTPLPPILTIPPEGEEFDYENKYNGRSQEIVPIPETMVLPEIKSKVSDIAQEVHELVGARHLSRVDFMVDDKGNVYVLEINTLPGMTKESFYPKSAKVSGLDMDDLTDRLLNLITEGA